LSTPSHGTAQIDLSWLAPGAIDYTADATFSGEDSFTYTVADPYGGEATGTIYVYDFSTYMAKAAGDYASWLQDGGQPAGPIALTLTENGSFTGYFTYYEVRYSFQGQFRGEYTELEVARKDQPPFRLLLHFGAEYGAYYAGDAQGPGSTPQLSGTLAPAGLSELRIVRAVALLPPDALVAETGQFNTVFPPPTVPSWVSAPRGNGYGIMRLSKRGRLTVSGRLGDNQPFTVGGRMARDRNVRVYARCGVDGRGTLYGLAEFGGDGRASGSGLFNWHNPKRPGVPYPDGFSLVVEAEGERFSSSDMDLLTNSNASFNVTVKDHAGMTVASTTTNVNKSGRLDPVHLNGERLRLRMNPRSGLFKGTIALGGARSMSVKGVMQPARGYGGGVFGHTGSDAGIEIQPP